MSTSLSVADSPFQGSVTVTGAGVTQYGYYRDTRLQQVKYPNGALANYTYDGYTPAEAARNYVKIK